MFDGILRLILTRLYAKYVDSIYLLEDVKYKEKDGYIWITAHHKGMSHFPEYRVPKMMWEQDQELLSVKYDKEDQC